MANDITTQSKIEATRATNRGTRIVKKGNELDKNSFLRILTAELKNQDPTNTKDSSQFVSQLAQFSALEQMSNLNSTMSFTGAQGLAGKVVALNAYDDMGAQYGGTVKSIQKVGNDINLTVEVMRKGKKVDEEFKLSDVSEVINMKDNRLDYINGNMGFLLASNMMNRNVEAVLYKTDDTGKQQEQRYSGMVKGVSRDMEGIKIKILVDEGGKVQEKYVPYDAVVKVDMPQETSQDNTTQIAPTPATVPIAPSATGN